MRVFPIIPDTLRASFKNNQNDYSPYRYPVRMVPLNNDSFIKNSNQPSFTSVIKSMKDFRKLGCKGVFHCIYCQRPLFPSPYVDKLKSRGVFSGSVLDFSKEIFSYLDYLHPTEKSASKQFVIMAFDSPNLTLSEATKRLYPEANKELLKEQLPIIKELSTLSENMPHGYKTKFKELIKISKYKLLEKEYIPNEFSGKEFSYKMNRMGDTVKDEVIATRIRKLTEPLTHPVFKKSGEPLTEKFKNHILSLTESRNNITTKITKKDLQLLLLNQIHKYGEILNRQDILNLCDTGIKTIEGQPVKIKFSNKVFKYDIEEILKDLPDKDLKEKIIQIIHKLPTSKTSVNAFITKHENAASDAIGYDILRPSILTIEHMHPKSQGGSNDLSNLALSCERDNNTRSSENMKTFIEAFPIKNQQNYFKEIWIETQKGNILKSDAIGMINTFFNESGRNIDISKFNY